MEEIRFYPMTECPVPDESDASFSKTVLVYGSKLNVIGLGYYDFEMNEWLHFGDNTFLLKYWCYVPNILDEGNVADWKEIAPRGYMKPYLQD